MPAQQRGRLDEQPVVPTRARQQPRESSQDRSVGPVEPWPDYLPPRHRDLVPEHQQLSVFPCRSLRQQREPSHHPAEQQIQQS
jgi:hypothetical protein